MLFTYCYLMCPRINVRRPQGRNTAGQNQILLVALYAKSTHPKSISGV